ncbi:CAMK protein kinase [Phytophthora megakarya]|uniref:CAMK protein kinase n=1 Tax=Phytophthora megakarya TaxID=4795 RepID=A0A225X0Q6_9STRA|nr:CAMK protein kinase [Phytophthora megakarya]
MIRVGISRALRRGGGEMRALQLTRRMQVQTIPANTVNLRSIALLQYAHYAGGESCSGKWSNKELLVAGASLTVVAITGDSVLCDEIGDEDESVVRRSNVCGSGGDNEISTYFDAEYEPKKLLGCGTFGVVMQCVHKQSGRMAAVKMVQNVAGNQEEVEREKEALERLERAGGHESIVGYEGSYYHNDFHYIVLECVPGISLHSHVERHHTLDPTLSLHLTSQLASALQFMHQSDVIHRDLKPENIMTRVNSDKSRRTGNTNEDVTLKIIDFGSAGRLSEPESVNKPRNSPLSGTRCYWPPEVLQRQDMTAAMDMWALGCILYILISGRHPFDLTGCSTEDEVLQRVKTEPVSFLLPVWRDVPSDTKELIRGLLNKDPHQRLSANQVLEHRAIIKATKEL